jgi:hypothetical protein
VRGGSASGAGGKLSFEDLDFSELSTCDADTRVSTKKVSLGARKAPLVSNATQRRKDHDYVFSVWRE